MQPHEQEMARKIESLLRGAGLDCDVIELKDTSGEQRDCVDVAKLREEIADLRATLRTAHAKLSEANDALGKARESERRQVIEEIIVAERLALSRLLLGGRP